MTSCDLSDQTKNWKNTKKIAVSYVGICIIHRDASMLTDVFVVFFWRIDFKAGKENAVHSNLRTENVLLRCEWVTLPLIYRVFGRFFIEKKERCQNRYFLERWWSNCFIYFFFYRSWFIRNFSARVIWRKKLETHPWRWWTGRKHIFQNCKLHFWIVLPSPSSGTVVKKESK